MLHELDKDSLLLLYLADEMSSADRAEVDRMLSADAGLRQRLASLDSATQSFEAQMVHLDAEPLSDETASMRRIGQLMRQRLTEQLVKPAKAPAAAASRLRYPIWAYPGVAAAVILLGLITWWGSRPDPMLKTSPSPIVRGPASAPSVSDDAGQLAEDIRRNFEAPNLAQPEKSYASLNAAEDQIMELNRSKSDFRYSDGNE